MSGLRSTFGANLERARKRRGWTREFLGGLMQCDPMTIRNYERGVRWPDPEMIERLSVVLDVPVARMFLEENERPPMTMDDVIDYLGTVAAELRYEAKANLLRAAEPTAGVDLSGIAPEVLRELSGKKIGAGSATTFRVAVKAATSAESPEDVLQRTREKIAKATKKSSA
jgi:transcriptional regulator with XRE-family HTH domain